MRSQLLMSHKYSKKQKRINSLPKRLTTLQLLGLFQELKKFKLMTNLQVGMRRLFLVGKINVRG